MFTSLDSVLVNEPFVTKNQAGKSTKDVHRSNSVSSVIVDPKDSWSRCLSPNSSSEVVLGPGVDNLIRSHLFPFSVEG